MAAVAVMFLGLTVVAAAQMVSLAENSSINYSKSEATDPVAKLQQRIDSGEVSLAYDEAHGYLPAVLKALQVPKSSQGLVFSRTSLQVDRIAPWTPRAIYFNDELYVGWVQGGPIMEVASADPKLGAVFYTLAQDKTDHPKFERQTHLCLQCHDSSTSTGGVPGFIMRSVVTDRYGYPVLSDSGATTDITPMEKRWGGWYVTGTLGNPPHMGNVFVPKLAGEIGNVQSYLSQNHLFSTHDVTSLKDRFDVDPYLSPGSDAVALLVLAHQTSVHNLITLAGYETRIAGGELDARAKGVADRLANSMMFAHQATLPAPVTGTSTFTEQFQAMGPKDSQGRSLRDLDLHEHVFKYPLSYLIYSDSFNALPDSVKQYVYGRIRAEASPDVLQILKDTKPEVVAGSAGL